ncbi:YjjG family noncanonical pyrimidine nucleotidase [Staphylococcus caeli]|uniref:Hydrolase n=1 Tax=Staphylococcus caeli TaxID=2201815 RepID=A0A1D4MIH1_9STAP|nr:YjjG family noncanonical pyrimidine nucleotidase [Staphylococcus caeli]SCS98204.1 hydrolase [Staphylococcus caeli]SCT17183.1 hydrolase [Staphylococcus caeli]
MKRKSLLLDFDDTIVDFKSAEAYAFYKLAEHYNLEVNNEDLQNFMLVNEAHWNAFQKNELTKTEVLSQRFEVYFESHQLTVDGNEADQIFRNELANAPIKYFRNTKDTLAQLKTQHDLYIVTNGVLETQERRIAKTEIEQWFKDIFVSEQTGYQKPMPEFFDFVFNVIGEDKRENAIIIGDSLSSDILGGKNAGIKTCWFNPRKKINESSIIPDHTINSLDQILTLIK